MTRGLKTDRISVGICTFGCWPSRCCWQQWLRLLGIPWSAPAWVCQDLLEEWSASPVPASFQKFKYTSATKISERYAVVPVSGGDGNKPAVWDTERFLKIPSGVLLWFIFLLCPPVNCSWKLLELDPTKDLGTEGPGPWMVAFKASGFGKEFGKLG